MLRKLAAALALIPLLVAPARLKAQLSKETPSLVAFPEVGIALAQPQGFEKADSFYGFQQPSTGASVMVLAIPGPFGEVTKGFTKTALAEKGLTLHSKEPIQIDGQSGLQIHFSQKAFGQEFLKWVVLFGNIKQTKMVVTSVPQSHAAELNNSLQTVIRSISTTQKNAAKVETLPFQLEVAPSLSLVEDVANGNTFLFTKMGTVPTTSSEDPLFIVAFSLGDVLVVGNRKEYARQRLFDMAETDVESLQSTTPVTIDGLKGYELIAIGKDQKTQTPLSLYQVMLFPDDGGYILMTGMVGQDQAKRYLSQFKAMAETFQQMVKYGF